MSESVFDVQDAFNAFLNDAAGTHGWALNGLRLLRQDWERRLVGSVADAHVFMSLGAPNDPNTLAYQRWKLANLPARLADDGPVAATIGQQWVVGVYTAWEEHFRARFAAADGKTKAEKTWPIGGDLRLLRHDIVHHRGVATSTNTGKCAVLRWFEAGDQILVTQEMVAGFMRLLGLAQHMGQGQPPLP